MSSPIIWISILVVMNLFWAGSYTVMKVGLSSLDPVALVFWRLALGLVALSAWIAIRRCPLALTRREAARIAGAGLSIALSSLLTVKGVEMSHATDASLLYVFEPVFAIILASIVLKERLIPTTIVGLLICLAGLWRLSGGDIAAFGIPREGAGLGNVLIVAGLLSETMFTILLKPIAARRPAPVVFAGVLAVACAILVAPMYLRTGFSLQIGASGAFAIAYLALLCTALGYTAWVAVLRHVPVSIMEFTIFVQPISGMLIAAAALGEPIDSRVLAGGGLLIAGMATAVIGHMKLSKRAKKASICEIAAPADAL